MKHLMCLILTCYIVTFFSHSQTFNRYRSPIDTIIQSSFLGHQKNVQLFLPLDYDNTSTKHFPIIVIFDSQDELNYNYTIQTIDYLTVNEQMPSSIIIGIASDQKYQYSETAFFSSDSSGKAHLTEKFLLDELLPMVRNNFQGSSFTTVIGRGCYGTFGTYLLTRQYPEIHAVIAFNPPLEQKNVNLSDSLKALLKKDPIGHRTYFRYDFGNNYPENIEHLKSLFSHANPLKTNLDAKGVFFRDADPQSTSGLYISQALYEIFEFWSAKQNTYFGEKSEQLPTVVSQIHEEIKTHYGQQIGLSLGALNGKGWALYNSGNFEASIEAWQLVLAYYPHFSEAYLSIAYAQKDLHQPIDSTLQQFEENLHSSHFYSAGEQEELMDEYNLLLTIRNN